MLICDNDNAVFDGRSTEIDGTLEFMAPELVRGDVGASPSVQTDLHALAVLLFMLFMNHHPLHGKREFEIHCFDEKARRWLYGDVPLFIFDPDDRANRPDRDEQATAIAMWRFIPDTLRRLFVKAFTVGLRDRNARVRESEWIDALGRCRDSIISCSHCRKQTMTEPDAVLAQLGACWRCNSKLESLGALNFAASDGTSRRVLLDHETRVYAHHLGEDRGRHDFQHALAEVREHPRRPGRYGLTNLDDRSWQVTVRSGQNYRVAKDGSVALHGGTTITVGACQATVLLG